VRLPPPQALPVARWDDLVADSVARLAEWEREANAKFHGALQHEVCLGMHRLSLHGSLSAEHQFGQTIEPVLWATSATQVIQHVYQWRNVFEQGSTVAGMGHVLFAAAPSMWVQCWQSR
jgi:hypothetical protein